MESSAQTITCKKTAAEPVSEAGAITEKTAAAQRFDEEHPILSALIEFVIEELFEHLIEALLNN